MNSSSRGESSLNVDSSALIACSGAAAAAVEQVFSKADTDSDVFPGKHQGCQRFVLTLSVKVWSHLQTFRVEMLVKGCWDNGLALKPISN